MCAKNKTKHKSFTQIIHSTDSTYASCQCLGFYNVFWSLLSPPGWQPPGSALLCWRNEVCKQFLRSWKKGTSISGLWSFPLDLAEQLSLLTFLYRYLENRIFSLQFGKFIICSSKSLNDLTWLFHPSSSLWKPESSGNLQQSGQHCCCKVQTVVGLNFTCKDKKGQYGSILETWGHFQKHKIQKNYAYFLHRNPSTNLHLIQHVCGIIATAGGNPGTRHNLTDIDGSSCNALNTFGKTRQTH